MPAVSFTKAIDVWMATCLVFVFGSFIEYSVVNVLARREKMNRQALQQDQQQQKPQHHRLPNIIDTTKQVFREKLEHMSTLCPCVRLTHRSLLHWGTFSHCASFLFELGTET